MAERQTMPTFVPRTVASFERAATAVARRVAAPVRMLATRALSFADRLVGSWAGAGPMVGGFEVGRERAPMLASGRGGGMPMPRPWYEVEADEDVVLRPQPGMSGDAGPTGTVATAALAARVIAAAERGAAITRTNVTAPPEAVAREGARPGAPATAPAGTAAPTATTAAPGATPAVPAAAETTSATTAGAGSVAGAAAADANASAAASVRDGSGEARVTVAADDVRVAEALGLRATSVAPATVAVAPVARATTPLGRALAHAAWVDAQLRTLTTAAETSRPAAGYVFIAPADEPVRAAGRGETIAAPAATRAANVPAATWVAPARAAAASAVTGASAAPVAAWSARLPDPRLSEAMPTASAQRVAAFVAQLVGAETARDVAPLSATAMPAATAMATPAEAPVAASARVAPQPTYVALPSVSWRPGAAAARIEQLGAQVDARVMAAWGEPSLVAQPGAARTMVAQPGVALDATPASAPGGAAARMPERVALAAASAPSAPSLARPAIQTIYVAPEMRATGPARMAAFVQQLVGVQAARATAPLPVQAMVAAPTAEARASAAPAGTVAAAGGAGAAGAPSAASLRVPERIALAATMSPPVGAQTMGVGGVARRAEQLGGLVGVRAASLSIDFVDPARFALLAESAPSLPTVAPEATPPAGDTIMPAPRPLFAAPARAAAPLTAEEWSLVATFPSAATAVQLAAARASQSWRPAPATTFVAGGSQLSARAIAARGGAPGEYVAPSLMASVVPAESQRLPSGRMPRGSFTWPKLAEPAPARAEWSSSPAAAVAEQSAQAAPGMPLWGTLPRLETVSPSLAASTGMTSPESATRAALAPPAGTANAMAAAGAADVATPGAAARHAGGAAPAAPASSATRGDAPAMTLMTAAATRDARAAARLGAREAGAPDASPTLTAAGPDAPRGAGVSNVRPPAMPLMSGGPTAARDGGAVSGGPSARALELARPFLKLVEGGLTGSDGAARASAAGSRFFEQPQPLVAGAPSSDSTARIVEALRSQPATASGDDRVSLADLTLIAIASATQQVAASPAGGGPGGGGAAAAPSSSSSEASSAHGGGKSAANPAQEIEELARAAFDELQHLLAMARERSGDHG